MISTSASLRRIWIAGITAVIISTLINLGISFLAKNLLPVSSAFAPLGIGPVVFWSILLGLGALLVFSALKRWSKRALVNYIFISVAVYVLTFFPDGWLLFGSHFPGTSVLAVLTLMSMHAAEAIILLGTLSVTELRKK